jgi:hypothetical protein
MAPVVGSIWLHIRVKPNFATFTTFATFEKSGKSGKVVKNENNLNDKLDIDPF